MKIKEQKWTQNRQRNRENRFSKIIMITSKNTHTHETKTKRTINIRNSKEQY
jgi:hypothetical protein